MRAKSLVLILIAAACGLVASIGISQVMDPNSASKVETEKIYVALTAIDIGTKLTETNVRIEAWPKDRIPQGAIMKFDELKDKYPRQRFFPDEPILLAKIGDRSGTATDKIPEGYRVIPVKVTSDGTVIELLSPGDRIDVLAVFRKNADIRVTGCKTILRDVRVYSVGTATERIVDEGGKTRQAQTVSLLVTPKQSQKVLMAMELGRLQFTLRNQNEPILNTDQDEIDFQEFLSAPAENGSVDHSSQPAVAAPPTQPKESFSDWLKAQAAAAIGTQTPAPESTQWKTLIVTPDDIESYEWQNEDELPSRGTPAAAPKFPAKSAAQSVSKSTPNPSAVAQPEMEVHGTLVGGGSLDWSRFQGKNVIIVTWKTDCPTCSEQLPLVKGLVEHYQANQFAVIGICPQRDERAIRKQLGEKQLDWPTVFGEDAERWVAANNVPQVPFFMLVDTNGRLTTSSSQVVSLAAEAEQASREASSKIDSNPGYSSAETDQ